MAFDIKNWLKTDLQMSDEDIALVETKLAPKAQIIESAVLRQQDYSAKMADVQRLQGEIRAKDDRLTAEATEWASLTAAEKATNEPLRRSIEALEVQKLQLTQRLTSVATQAGIDPKTALEGLETEPVTKPAPAPAPAVDTSKFVDREAFNGIAAMALELPALLSEIADEHRELVGARLDQRAIVREIQSRAATRGNVKSLDPRQVWEEMHEIPAKRAARETERYNAAISAAKEEGRMAALTEASIPGATPVGRHSPVLVRPGHESVLKRPQPGVGLQGAVSAFTSGKYRNGAPAKTA